MHLCAVAPLHGSPAGTGGKASQASRSAGVLSDHQMSQRLDGYKRTPGEAPPPPPDAVLSALPAASPLQIRSDSWSCTSGPRGSIRGKAAPPSRALTGSLKEAHAVEQSWAPGTGADSDDEGGRGSSGGAHSLEIEKPPRSQVAPLKRRAPHHSPTPARPSPAASRAPLAATARRSHALLPNSARFQT